MLVSDELKQLASILADWVSPAPSFKIYLYGSRVRGDHRTTSDVDVCIDFGERPGPAETKWWSDNNADLFKDINRKLPGPLEILELHAPLREAVLNAAMTALVYRDRQVICVHMDRYK